MKPPDVFATTPTFDARRVLVLAMGLYGAQGCERQTVMTVSALTSWAHLVTIHRCDIERGSNLVDHVERGRCLAVEQSPQVRTPDAGSVGDMRQRDPALRGDISQPARQDAPK